MRHGNTLLKLYMYFFGCATFYEWLKIYIISYLFIPTTDVSTIPFINAIGAPTLLQKCQHWCSVSAIALPMSLLFKKKIKLTYAELSMNQLKVQMVYRRNRIRAVFYVSLFAWWWDNMELTLHCGQQVNGSDLNCGFLKCQCCQQLFFLGVTFSDALFS